MRVGKTKEGKLLATGNSAAIYSLGIVYIHGIGENFGV